MEVNEHGRRSATPVHENNGSISTVNRHGRTSATPDNGNNISIATVKETKQKELDQGSEHILLLDDESAIVKMQTLRLDRLGYTVTAFEDAREALVFFEKDPDRVDLIITDMTMPGMTGDSFAKAIKEIAPDIPIILCTGHSEKVVPETVSDIGVQEVMMKPVGYRDMATTVRRLLDHTKK